MMTKLTALAMLPLVATVVALLAFTSDTRADFLGDCPTVFTTQDVCYINVASLNDITVTNGFVSQIGNPATGTNGERILNASDHGDAVAIYPADGCSSFVGGFDAIVDTNEDGETNPQDCFAPLRFSAGGINYCIQDNQAHTWQLCSTPDTMPSATPAQEGNTNTEQAEQATANSNSQNPEWGTNCASRAPGVYGTAANPLLCWADFVGGNLGGDTDPWGTSWVTFTDCTPEGCRTYN